MNDEQVPIDQLKKLAFAEVVEMFEGDREEANRWLFSRFNFLQIIETKRPPMRGQKRGKEQFPR